MNRISGGKVSVFTKTNGLPENNVSAVYSDLQGTVWVGTSSGLARFKAGQWHSFTSRDGLPGNSIRYILEDEAGSLWLGSNAGLLRLNKQDLDDFAAGQPRALFVREFGKSDGMPTRECSQGSQPAATATKDGRLWFSTIQGLTFVDPKALRPNTNPPPVVLEAVLVDNQPKGTNSVLGLTLPGLTIPARRETLEIQFAVLNLSAPEKARFRYRLEDYETSWTEGSGNHGSIRYTKLPAREYTFRVKAANADGAWNETGATFR